MRTRPSSSASNSGYSISLQTPLSLKNSTASAICGFSACSSLTLERLARRPASGKFPSGMSPENRRYLVVRASLGEKCRGQCDWQTPGRCRTARRAVGEIVKRSGFERTEITVAERHRSPNRCAPAAPTSAGTITCASWRKAVFNAVSPLRNRSRTGSQSSAARREPWLMARLASSSAATSAPPMHAPAGRQQAVLQLAQWVLAGADDHGIHRQHLRLALGNADMQAGVVDPEIHGIHHLHLLVLQAGAMDPAGETCRGRRRPCFLRCRRNTWRAGCTSALTRRCRRGPPGGYRSPLPRTLRAQAGGRTGMGDESETSKPMPAPITATLPPTGLRSRIASR